MKTGWKRRQESFSARLSYDFVFIAAILFISLLTVAALLSHRILAEEATRSAQNRLEASIKTIENKLKEAESAVEGVAWLVNDHLDDPEYCYHIVSELVSSSPVIVGSAVAFPEYYFPDRKYYSPYAFEDVEGNVHTKQLGSEDYDYFFSDWYQIPVLLGRPCWSEPYFDELGADIKMSTYSRPVKDANGNLVAVLTADISLDWIRTFLEGMKPYPSSKIALISRCGSYVNVAEGQLLGETIFSLAMRNGEKDVLALSSKMISGESGVARVGHGLDVNMVVYGHLSNGWCAAMVTSYSDVLKNASRLHINLLVVGLLGLVILFFLCYFVTRKLTKPLKDITESAINIADGDFTTELPEIKSEDEIRKLRDAFDHMQKSLTEYVDRLKTTTSANARFESELSIASKIQMAMLPHDFPKVAAVDLHATVRPAKEVGGDLYDFFVKDDVLFFTVGDVSGKGVPASLYMAIARAAFRFIAGMGATVEQVVSKMNNAICQGNDGGMFITLFVGRIDLRTGEFKYCNAGHNPIVLIDPDKGPEYLNAKANLALGVFPDFDYVSQEMTVKKGTRLVIYTDGVTEAERGDKCQYGEDRLIGWAASSDKFHSAREACDGLMQDVHDFVEGNEQNDDITIMTIKINQ